MARMFNAKKLYKMNNTTEQTTNGRRRIAEGRTIVMTTPWSLWGELRSAEILGRKVLGWDVDRENRTAYVVLERESVAEVPVLHLVDTDAWDGSWQGRLKALEAMPASTPRRGLSPIEKLVAWFSGRMYGRMSVQEGGRA